MKRVIEPALWWAVLILLWQCTISTPALAELVFSAAVSLPVALAAPAMRHAVRGSWRPPPQTVRLLAALPGAVLHDTVAVLRLARDRPRGRSERIALPREPEGPRWDGRTAVTGGILSATPGSLVFDADRRQGTLVAHTLPIPENGLQRRVRESR